MDEPRQLDHRVRRCLDLVESLGGQFLAKSRVGQLGPTDELIGPSRRRHPIQHALGQRIVGTDHFEIHPERVGQLGRLQIVVDRRFREETLAERFEIRLAIFAQSLGVRLARFFGQTQQRPRLAEEGRVECLSPFEQGVVVVDRVPGLDGLGHIIPCPARFA